MKTILLVILAMGRNCILEAPEPEPAEVIKSIPLQFHEFFLCCYHKTQILRAQIVAFVAVQILRKTATLQFGKKPAEVIYFINNPYSKIFFLEK